MALIQKPLLSNKHKVRELVSTGYALFVPKTGQSVRKRILDKRELHIKYKELFLYTVDGVYPPNVHVHRLVEDSLSEKVQTLFDFITTNNLRFCNIGNILTFRKKIS